MRRLIIGLTGNKGSGKDTFAQVVKDYVTMPMDLRQKIIRDCLGSNNIPSEAGFNIDLQLTMTKQIAFADRLRTVCAEAFEQPIQLFTDVSVKDSPALPVTQCQTLGGDTPLKTDFTPRDVQREVAERLREIFPSIWIDPVVSAINRRKGSRWLITDLRYPEQWVGLKEGIPDTEFYVLNIRRPGHDGDSHISETSFAGIPYDHQILNQGTLDQFRTECFNTLVKIYALRANQRQGVV
jgi:hypothetical protein